jgi:anaerobic C4-dicarboxylate transporter DcuA/anaerobic C4-dicarboxylate transporter DcuB
MSDNAQLVLQLITVIVFIYLGVRMGGIGLGLWGGAGVLFFAFVLNEAPGEPPINAMLIILAVITAASAMQAAGGMDYLVKIASNIIKANPKNITFVAPIISFFFTVGSGTSNIFFSLIPVIEETAYKNDIRPERPLAASLVANGLAISASPVSAAMAVMVGLMEPLGFDLTDILLITIPASLVAIVIGSFMQSRLGKELKDDPEYQRRVAAGEIEQREEAVVSELKPRAALSAYLFLAGVAAIILLGLFEDLRPVYEIAPDEFERLDVTTTIQIAMLTVALLIVLLCQIGPGDVLKAPVFSSGMVGLIALFGIAWLADTFVVANEDTIVDVLGDLVLAAPLTFAIAIFAMAALTTSQSATTKSIVPIGIALAIPAQMMIAMWPSLIGVYFLPANGTQLAAVAMDRTGTTKIGNAVLNHSFMPNVIVMWIATVLVGLIVAAIAFGTDVSAEQDAGGAEEPVAEATASPTPEPTAEPTEEATPEPTDEATPEATEEATPEATEEATPEATEEAEESPSASPAPSP